MKISKQVLILSSAGLGLTLVYCGQGTNSTPTKAQQILRQKIAELNNADSLPGKDQLLADVERLHKEGKISDQQFETFKKNINEQYAAASGPANSEAQAKAQKLLEQKIAELNAEQKAVLPSSNPEIQAKAEQALRQKLKELQAGVRTHPETGTIAQQVLNQKIAELRTQEKINVIASGGSATLASELEANARELLRAQIAASRRGELNAPEPSPETQARAMAILRQRETELKAGVTPDTSEPVRIERPKIAESKGIITAQEAAKTAAAPAVTATIRAALAPELEANARELVRAQIAASRRGELNAPAPSPETQARTTAILRQRETELKAGVTPDTSEPVRIERLKIAESKGIITAQEAAKTAAAPAVTATIRAAPVAAISQTAAPGTGTPARATITPPSLTSPVPFFTSNKVGLARLNELTALYKSDRITPYEYHHERAKIVASL